MPVSTRKSCLRPERLACCALQGYVEPPDGPAPPATLASAQRLAAQLVSSPTRVLLLKNMLRAGQMRDDEERKDVRACSRAECWAVCSAGRIGNALCGKTRICCDCHVQQRRLHWGRVLPCSMLWRRRLLPIASVLLMSEQGHILRVRRLRLCCVLRGPSETAVLGILQA